MSTRRRVAQGLAAVGLAGAGAATAGVVRHNRGIARREGRVEDLGSLRGEVVTVVASDGVRLHVEVDEPDVDAPPAAKAPTVVLVHGYVLNLDCWHFQRAHLRGGRRVVLYDQRSHGRSDASERGRANIDQLGDDLRRVLEAVAPDEKVVLVGHSMGGMSIMAFAETHPEAFRRQVVGVALLSTTAGGLTPSRLVVPFLPRRLTSPLADRGMATLARGPRLVDLLRRAGADVGRMATDLMAFGQRVPASLVDYVDDMISSTSFDVISAFFPSFGDLDKFEVLDRLAEVPTWLVCGTSDKLTSIGHSRKMAAMMPWARLVEVAGAGHMVIMEQPGPVNSALDDLLASVDEAARHPVRAARRRRRQQKQNARQQAKAEAADQAVEDVDAGRGATVERSHEDSDA